MNPCFKQLPPLALYIHIPWCVRKCSYCDFNSHSISHDLPEHAYVQALLADLERELPLVQGRKLHSVFLGGGTPSLFSPESIAKLLDAARNMIGFTDNIEITLEANPGTLEQNKFAGFYDAGVNRLSIGVQSFNDDHLQCLERIHDSLGARTAIESALRAGFTNINLDLMHGLPKQSVTAALQDLQTATRFKPQHISWYQLAIEPNTHFYKKPPPLPSEEVIEMMEAHGQDFFIEQGYQQYEVSAWCQPGRESRHNLNYWQFGDYLGIGAGAHGKITLMQDQRIVRSRKTRSPADYLGQHQHPTRIQKSVRPEDLPGEFMLNALRLNRGFCVTDFEQSTGLPIKILSAQLHKACTDGLLTMGKIIEPTKQGRLFLDSLIEYFV